MVWYNKCYNLVLTFIISIVCSILVMPIFSERYLFPVLGCFWFGFSILLAKNFNKKEVFIPILIILLCATCVNTLYFVNCSDIGINNYEKYDDLIFNEGDLIISDNIQTKWTFFRWFNPECTPYTFFVDNVNYSEIINDTLNNNHTIWVFIRNDGKSDNIDYDIITNLSNEYNLVEITQLQYDPFSDFPTMIYQVQRI